MLRKWPHKSDSETHLWMLVKVLLLITSKVSEAEGVWSWEMESSRPRSRCQLPEQQRWGSPWWAEAATFLQCPDPHLGLPAGTGPALPHFVNGRQPLSVLQSLGPAGFLATPSSPNPPLPGATTLSRWCQPNSAHCRMAPNGPCICSASVTTSLPLLPRGLFLFGDPPEPFLEWV